MALICPSPAPGRPALALRQGGAVQHLTGLAPSFTSLIISTDSVRRRINRTRGNTHGDKCHRVGCQSGSWSWDLFALISRTNRRDGEPHWVVVEFRSRAKLGQTMLDWLHADSVDIAERSPGARSPSALLRRCHIFKRSFTVVRRG